MKLYYDQQAKDHPFRVDHKVLVHNPNVKLGLLKRTMFPVAYGPFGLTDQATPVSFKVGSIHVNRMKQYSTYDNPPIDPPSQSNSI